MVRTVLREPAGSRTLSTLEAFVVLSLSSGGWLGGGEVVRVFGEEIVCANIVFADGLTHVVAAFFSPYFRFQTGANGQF